MAVEIGVPVFIDLENRMQRVMQRAVVPALREQTSEMEEAARAGNLGRAARAAERIDLGEPLERVRGSLELIGLNQVLLGAAQFVAGRSARDTRFVRDREAPPEVEMAVSQLIVGMRGRGSQLVREEVQTILLEAEAEDPTRGLGAREVQVVKQAVGQDLASRLNQAVATGTRVQSSISANLTTSRLVQFGALSQAQAGGVTTYQWNAQLDERTCPFCRGMHGKTFEVAPAMRDLSTILRSQDPDVARSLSPWPRITRQNINRLAGLTDDKLQEEGLAKPPAHPRCRCVLSVVGTVPRSEIRGFQVRPLTRPGDPAPARPTSLLESPVRQADFDDLGTTLGAEEVEIGEGAVAGWDAIFGRRAPDRVLTDLVRDTGTRFNRVTIRGGVKGPTAETRNMVNVSFDLDDAAGEVFATVERSFFRGDDGVLVVRHAFLELAETAQGKGFGKKFLRNSLRLYEEAGVAEIRLVADIDAGGYAWARYGFVPDPDEWRELKGFIERRMIKQQLFQTQSDEAIQAVNAALRSDDPRAIWKIADLREEVAGTGEPLGRVLLKRQEWQGRLRLDDPEVVARFRRYVES